MPLKELNKKQNLLLMLVVIIFLGYTIGTDMRIYYQYQNEGEIKMNTFNLVLMHLIAIPSIQFLFKDK